MSSLEFCKWAELIGVIGLALDNSLKCGIKEFQLYHVEGCKQVRFKLDTWLTESRFSWNFLCRVLSGHSGKGICICGSTSVT